MMPDDDEVRGESGRSGAGRKRPNILITGTPGVGKTALAESLAERLNMKHIPVGDLIRAHQCYEGRDEELDTYILDEDRLLDVMEPMFEEENDDDNDEEEADHSMNAPAGERGGLVVDFHVCDIFPARWFDLVLVLRAETAVLYDRLSQRGYTGRKRDENMEAEIMQVILEEAREAYDHDLVHEVPSNTLADLESNLQRVQQWQKQWIQDNSNDNKNGSDDTNS